MMFIITKIEIIVIKKSLALELHRDIIPEQLRDRSPTESRDWLIVVMVVADDF